MIENAIDTARAANGKRIKSIAADLSVSPDTIYSWRALNTRCPSVMRQSLDRAIGEPVNWHEYDIQFGAAAAARRESAISQAQIATDERHHILTPEAVQETSTQIEDIDLPEKPKSFWSDFGGFIQDDTAET